MKWLVDSVLEAWDWWLWWKWGAPLLLLRWVMPASFELAMQQMDTETRSEWNEWLDEREPDYWERQDRNAAWTEACQTEDET